ncbi:hypothetical protein SAMN05421858_3345 [Haladaptatus litoreus]|uniref:Copper binding protein, plastocyanin/azurin family n=1 Tax=Haladaptatus litoreus TaxID=553468 RepID=A0A1N7CYH9_9EURY|nr:hypothetical protein SAMN05421858_3345 [Haladaptatus litoreus]
MCCFRFGGHVSGWRGQGPQSIGGQQNPTLQLEAGRTYGVMWQNLDGQPHTFALRDSNGENLPVILPTVRTMQHGGPMMGGQNGTMVGGANGTMMDRMMGEHQGRRQPPEDAIRVTPQITEEGSVQMLAFVATRDVAQYICTVHPSTMVGDVALKPDQGNSGGQHSGNGNNGESDNTGSHAHG